MDKILDWYYSKSVKFEIVKQLYRRELALLIPSWCKNPKLRKTSTRMLKVHNANHYDFCLQALEYKQRRQPYNFYYSLATYFNGIPDQDLNFKRRDNTYWKTHHTEHMKSFDFLLDLDVSTHLDIDIAFQSARVITEFLNLHKCPYSLRFSGKGFHIVIYDFFFPAYPYEILTKPNIYMFYSMIAKKLYKRFSELIDLSIYDSRRVCKLPYSLALFPEKQYVCWCFKNYQEFLDFKLKDYDLDNFNKEIYKRGLFIINKAGGVDSFLNAIGLDNFEEEYNKKNGVIE